MFQLSTVLKTFNNTVKHQRAAPFHDFFINHGFLLMCHEVKSSGLLLPRRKMVGKKVLHLLLNDI